MAQVIGIGPGTRKDQTVYDPACGSGSLLIKAADAAPNEVLLERYADALPELVHQVEAYGAKVGSHLRRAWRSCVGGRIKRLGTPRPMLSTARWSSRTGCSDGTSWSTSRAARIEPSMARGP